MSGTGETAIWQGETLSTMGESLHLQSYCLQGKSYQQRYRPGRPDGDSGAYQSTASQ